MATDYEKMFQSIADEAEGCCTAVPPFFTMTLRRLPEVGDEKMAAMAAVLINFVKQLDRTLGGQGIEFDPAGTVQTDTKLTIRLMVVPAGDFIGRVGTITKTLNDLSGQALRDLAKRQDSDINAQIRAELASPFAPDVRHAAEHLEPVGVSRGR